SRSRDGRLDWQVTSASSCCEWRGIEFRGYGASSEAVDRDAPLAAAARDPFHGTVALRRGGTAWLSFAPPSSGSPSRSSSPWPLLMRKELSPAPRRPRW